jgi:hypothetical protein
MRNLLILIVATFFLFAGCSQQTKTESSDLDSISDSDLIGSQKLSSTIGAIELDNTYPTDETIQRLYEVRDVQRAVELYMWALPLVQFQAWKEGQEDAVGDGGMVYTTFNEQASLVTGNATTPYIMIWPDLSETGPMVVEMPAGQYASAILDWWEYPVCDLGLSGPDKGKGGKYIIVGPEEDLGKYKDKADYAFQSRTQKLFIGFRVLNPGEDAIKEFLSKVKIYPFGSEAKVPSFAFKSDKTWDGNPPLGLDYFKMLHRAIQDEPVRDRDKAFMGWLHYLGIEDGKPFEPNEYQARVMTEGANLGELMGRANAMDPHFTEPYYEGTQWYRLIDFPIEQEDEVRYYIDERAMWFYEAVTTTKGMKTETPGIGQVYLSVKRDKDGNILKGGEHYQLRVPANAPFEQFWSLTPYSEHTRGLIRSGITELIDANRDSRDERLKFNEDGSVDIYFGPNDSRVPTDRKANWMKTNPGEGWFLWFRLYAPKKEFFDKSWVLNDIEKIE